MSAWFDGATALRAVVAMLEWPVIAALFTLTAVAVTDMGVALGERMWGLRRLLASGDPIRAHALFRRRLDRDDLLARLGPMVGLMGTLVPLGPGLAALGRGDAETLVRSVTVAFDTTVLGLLVGALGFLLGRVRRRWYDAALDELEARPPPARPRTVSADGPDGDGVGDGDGDGMEASHATP